MGGTRELPNEDILAALAKPGSEDAPLCRGQDLNCDLGLMGSVALSRTVPRWTRTVVRVHSDRSGEFAEHVGDAPMGARIAPELVMAAPNVLHQRMIARAE
jgi:hypothetical protein